MHVFYVSLGSHLMRPGYFEVIIFYSVKAFTPAKHSRLISVSNQIDRIVRSNVIFINLERAFQESSK